MEGKIVSTERKERRGFASMSPEKQREIASKGGRAAHEKGTAHEWTADEARSAGRKGGQVSRGGRGRLVVATGAPEAGGPQAAMPPERFDANQPE
jgi:general stress protein YciG